MLVMEEKYYDKSTTLIMGIIFLILGLILLIGKTITYQYLITIFLFIILATTFLNTLKFFQVKDKDPEKNHSFLSCFINLIICIILFIIPNLTISIISIIFSTYLTIAGLTQLIMCIISTKNKGKLFIDRLIMGLIYLIISLPILVSPIKKLDTFLLCLSFYSILLGLSYLEDFIKQTIPSKVSNKLKRKIRITLPKIIEALIPYSIMTEINHNLEIQNKINYSYPKTKNVKTDLHILIHTSPRGVNKVGHIDICFQDKVISYGGYDEGSRKLHDIFGDGVLFITNKKKEYIEFCIDNSKKTIFDFGIILTENQKNRIEKKINDILKNTYPWNYKNDKKYQNNNTYSSKLYKKTNAKFYKFKKGRYKTYFVLGMNCCFLVDDIVGMSNTDILSINGIITPGTYYDYLNRELKRKNTNIITKEIYNYKRRPK